MYSRSFGCVTFSAKTFGSLSGSPDLKYSPVPYVCRFHAWAKPSSVTVSSGRSPRRPARKGVEPGDLEPARRRSSEAGDYPQALTHGRHSIAVFRAAGDLGCEAEALKDVGLVHQRQGRYDAAIRLQRRVQQPVLRLGDRLMSANAIGNFANIYDLTGRYEQAAAQYERALAEFRKLGDRAGEGKTSTISAYSAAGRVASTRRSTTTPGR